MDSYLDHFSTSIFSTKSSPEYFDTNFQDFGGFGNLHGIKEGFFFLLLDALFELGLEEIVVSEHAETFKRLRQERTEYDDQEDITLVRIHRKFYFGESQKIPEPKNEIYLGNSNTLVLSLGRWNFYFTYLKNLQSSYISRNNRLLIEPLFLNYNEEFENYELVEDTGKIVSLLKKQSAKSPCPCGSSNSKNFGQCCRTNLFFRIDRFGVYEINLIDKIREDSPEPNIYAGIADKSILPNTILEQYIKDKKPISLFLEALAEVPIPLYPQEEFEKSKQRLTDFMDALDKEMYLVSHNPHIVWTVEDSLGTVVKSAASKEAKLIQLYDSKKMYDIRGWYIQVEKILDTFFRKTPRVVKSLKQEIHGWKFISNQNKKFLSLSCEEAFKGNYDTASYLLYPQIEAMLRVYTKTKGIEIREPRTDGLVSQYKMLTSLVKDVFPGENAQQNAVKELFLRSLANEGAHSLNLRNELLHGFTGEIYQKQEYFSGLYLVILLNRHFGKQMQ